MACATPARLRLLNGNRQRRVRHGNPRHMGEFVATTARRHLRLSDIREARAWLVRKRLLSRDDEKRLPLERPRRSPWSPGPNRPPRIPTDIDKTEYHRDFD